MDFLYWICDKHRIKSDATIWEYFRQFKELCAITANLKIESGDTREIRKVLPFTLSYFEWHG